MNRPPAWQCYAKDILSSKAIALMTLEEVGAYFLLLNHCWDTDDCTLPNDDRELAVLSRMGKRWLSYGQGKNPVKRCFIPHPKKPTRLINSRMYLAFQQLNIFRRERQDAGRKGAKSRWKPIKSHDSSAITQPMAQPLSQPMAKHGSSSSSSSSSSIKRKRTPLISPLAGNSERTGLTRISEGLKAIFEGKLGAGQETLDSLREEPGT